MTPAKRERVDAGVDSVSASVLATLVAPPYEPTARGEVSGDASFDRLTRLVKRCLGVQACHISVVAGETVRLESGVGLPEEIVSQREIPLSQSFCQHILARGERFVVEEALGHPLVGRNPFVGPAGVRSYIGVPIGDDGQGGTRVLCAIDFAPRQWTSEEIATIEELAEMLRSELALRDQLADRARAEEQTALIMRELEHRVKNTLATVQAVVAMSLRSEMPITAARDLIIDRIASLSKTHSLLHDASWRDVTFQEIADRELCSYGEGDRQSLDGPRVVLNAQDAVLVGMVIHELATNAAKYGAFSTEATGRVDLSWNEIRSAEGRLLSLTWIESGIRRSVDHASRDGFGTSLLDTLVGDLRGGSLERDWHDQGLEIRAMLPVAA